MHVFRIFINLRIVFYEFMNIYECTQKMESISIVLKIKLYNKNNRFVHKFLPNFSFFLFFESYL